jgi:hypothetical protein
MQYPDGQLARLGDVIEVWSGNKGVVVCSLDTGEYTSSYPESDWQHLQRGVLVESEAAGLIHYIQPEKTMRLISRQTPI